MSAIPLSTDLFPKPNLSLVLYGKNDLRLETWPLPDKLEPDEVLLKSHSTGICGTDLHLWHNAQAADLKLTRPFCLGHEPSAIVMKCGSNVKHLQPGDNVAIEPPIPCLTCDICRSGRYNLCPISNEQSHGLPSSDGSLRRYYTHRADFCFKLPSSISLEEGTMVETLAVCVHAFRRLEFKPGENVLICGAGPIGVLCLMVAKAFGCDQVCITDIKQSRLEMAKQMGADHCYLIDAEAKKTEPQIAQEISKLMGGKAPDVGLECSGFDSSQTLAVHAVKYGGRICLLGLGSPVSRVPLSTVIMKEIVLIGAFRIKDDYPMAIRLMETGRINVKPLITQVYPIEQSMEAFKLLGTPGVENVFKVLIQYDQ
ncbi:transforming growth factor beta-1-induced transcript 1 protein [Sarcoptes scabiei]|nr:transforming growth factor beta-1-induced transcript 1 protein [Sarcoptes scabiei]